MNSEIARTEFKRILGDYGIQGNRLAEAARIHPNSLYRFVKGEQELTLDKWFRLIEALPLEAREEYLAVVLHVSELNRLSISAKRALFIRLAAEFADSAKSRLPVVQQK